VRRHTTIRTTVRWGLVTTSVVSALAAGLGSLLIFRAVALHETETFLDRQAAVAAAIATRAQHFFLGPHGARTFGPRRLLEVTPTGRLGGRVPPALRTVELRPPQLASGHFTDVVRGDTVWVLDPVTLEHHKALRTYAIVLHRSVPSELASALFVLGFTLVAALVAAVVADAYTRRVSSSVRRLATFAEHVSRGDLSPPPASAPLAQAELEDLRGALADMVRSLQRASHRQTAFLLSISHDLRTPLTSIRGFAEAIEDDEIEDPRHAAAIIRREAQRIERLLADLIALAKLESDGFAVTLSPLELEPTLAHLAETARMRGRSRGLACTVEVAEDAIAVVADPERLSQALANVLNNAVKFARSRIAIRAVRRIDVVRIEVDDDGPGIDPALARDLFHRQVSPRPGNDGAVGSGLGLLIVSRLVEGMGGRVGLRSPASAEGGTAIVIELAAAQVGARARAS